MVLGSFQLYCCTCCCREWKAWGSAGRRHPQRCIHRHAGLPSCVLVALLATPQAATCPTATRPTPRRSRQPPSSLRWASWVMACLLECLASNTLRAFPFLGSFTLTIICCADHAVPPGRVHRPHRLRHDGEDGRTVQVGCCRWCTWPVPGCFNMQGRQSVTLVVTCEMARM